MLPVFQSVSVKSTARALAVCVLLGCAAVTMGKPASPPVPNNLGVAGQQVVILQPDPKLPGKFAWKVWAASLAGASQNNGFQGTLTDVAAVLFQKGVAAARMRAPQAQADSAAQIVTATGRVQVWSLTQPGTTLQADKVVWRVRENKARATGNVVYQNGKTGLTVHVPSLDADTALKSISFGTGHAALR